MTKQYSPRHFFRNVSNELLAAYFLSKQTLTGFDFQGLPEAKIDPLYDEWVNLPDTQRQLMEGDFREIHAMAREGATKAFIDEAKYHGEDISGDLSRLQNHCDRAFWIFLNRRHYWQGATCFLHVDTIAASFWIRRTDIPIKKPNLTRSRIAKLEKAVGQFFHEQQGRGCNCHIEHYRRNDLLYLFAYPEDYTQARVEWVDQQFERPSRTPAFEVIFAYSQNDGTLDIMLRRDRKVVEHLQNLFVEIILNSSMTQPLKVDKVYELNKLKNRNFPFVFPPTSSIADVRVKRLRFSNKFGGGERIILEAHPDDNRDAIFRLMDKTFDLGNPLADYQITQVSLKVTFKEMLQSRRLRHKTVDISYPDSCSLKHEGSDLEIRQMLLDSGLEVRRDPQKDGDLSADVPEKSEQGISPSSKKKAV
jgi:hypothetical protein